MDESKLELHPETVINRQDTYSSLTDLWGIDIFTSEYEELVIEHKKKEQAEDDRLSQTVFEMEVKQQADTDEGLTEVLFLNQGERVLTQDYEKNVNATPMYQIGMVLLAVIAVVILYTFFFRSKKKWSR